jgi:hypothetical protein
MPDFPVEVVDERDAMVVVTLNKVPKRGSRFDLGDGSTAPVLQRSDDMSSHAARLSSFAVSAGRKATTRGPSDAFLSRSSAPWNGLPRPRLSVTRLVRFASQKARHRKREGSSPGPLGQFSASRTAALSSKTKMSVE